MAKELAGTSPTIFSPSFRRKIPSEVTFPITVYSIPQLPNIFPISSPLSFLAINNILSWVSESIISLGVIPFSLRGTKERSSSIPQFPLLAISQVELTNPAAPKSCIPKISPSFTSSKQASINSFSKKGLP
ncbi:hypothetical protein ES708_30406 [subsurface metagenome]